MLKVVDPWWLWWWARICSGVRPWWFKRPRLPPYASFLKLESFAYNCGNIWILNGPVCMLDQHFYSTNLHLIYIIIAYLTMCFCYWQALNPFLCIGPIFCFQNELLVVGKNFKCFWDVASTFFRYLHTTDRAYIQMEGIVMDCITFLVRLQKKISDVKTILFLINNFITSSLLYICHKNELTESL